MDQDDVTLIQRCQAGDLTAFEPLVERYRERAWRIAYQVVRDREEASDVAQEAFIRAYQSLASFRGQSTFYTWLFRIVVNLSTDRLRQRASRGRALGPEQVPEAEIAGTIADDATNRPDDEAARRETRERIAHSLDALPPNYRAIIMLSDVEGLSYREIAAVLNIPIGTVMSRLHNARKRLQRLLKPLLAILIILSVGMAGPADAQQAVRVVSRVLLATNGPLPPVAPPPDEHVRPMIVKLSELFRYKWYITLERYGAAVPLGVKQRWTVPGDRELEVMPESIVDRSVMIHLRLAKGSLTELRAHIQAQPGRPALIGGPRYNDGVLIIIIWAHPQPE